MDNTLFEQLATAYGADIKRWPAQHQPEARELLHQRPAMAEILSRYRRLDAMLDLDPPAKASAALKERILMSASETFIVWFSRELRRYAMLFLMVAAAGAWVGASTLGDIPMEEKTLDQILIVNALGPSE